MSVKLVAVLRKAFLRSRLERDAAKTAARLTQQPPGADRMLVGRLKRVHLALLRIPQRDYGTCASCGRPISDARLSLLPATATCAACQKLIDAQAQATSKT